MRGLSRLLGHHVLNVPDMAKAFFVKARSKWGYIYNGKPPKLAISR